MLFRIESDQHFIQLDSDADGYVDPIISMESLRVIELGAFMSR